jgi:signal transduction histidine kinase
MRLAERVRKHDHSPVAEAMRTRRICRTTRAVAGRSEPASVVAMPIAGDEEPAGVLELLKIDGQFSQDDEWFLQQISLIAGLGIGNAKLVDSMGQLKRFDKAKSRFVALLMHQISSPLATIACSLEALRQVDDKLSKDKRRKLMHYSMDRINSIQTLSRNLLNLASIRAGTSLMQVRPVSAAETLRNEVEARAEQAREKGVEMAVQGNDAGALVLADPDGLQVIFSNLLDNAIKYSVGPVKKVEAEVEVAEGDAFVCVRVRDKGIGIPPEEQSAVFEEFHRASNVSRSLVSGSGIGLATVRELVERYNGRISLESVLGAGTTVSVEFPVVVDTSCENESVE